MSRSRILLIVTLAVVVAVARLLLPSTPTEDQAPGQAPLAHPETAPLPAGDLPSEAEAPPSIPDSQEARAAMERAEARAEKARTVAAKLRHRARFPPTSRRIEDNVDPIVETRAVKERLSPPSQGRAPTLVVFASSLSYEAPSPVILYAKFIRTYPEDWSLRTDAEIAGELVNADGEVVAQVDLRDDGAERDIEAGDGVFTTRLTPAEEDLERWNGLIVVRVYGATADGDRRSAKTRFYYGVPSAKLTGRYRDELVDGHLEIGAEIDVQEAGLYRLDATLAGSLGLIAWARSTVALEPGVTWIPLIFWGLALREANEPGPYKLSSIALANVGVTPPQLNDAIGTRFETAPYRPQDFSDERYDDPELLENADRQDTTARDATTHAR